jgi:hypothetical protein
MQTQAIVPEADKEARKEEKALGKKRKLSSRLFALPRALYSAPTDALRFRQGVMKIAAQSVLARCQVGSKIAGDRPSKRGRQ